MKGIILAGGTGSRLAPITNGICKQLVPVYDKPMIYYPLSVLMLAGIREILLISTPADLPSFRRLLGDGSPWGLRLEYAEQESPRGLPEAFTIGADFLAGESAALILGDNIFYGDMLPQMLAGLKPQPQGATIFVYRVADPQRFGVVEFDEASNVVGIVEKPAKPRSNWALTGLCFFDGDVVEAARTLQPSARGELELSDLLGVYLGRGRLQVRRMGRGMAWLDMGTPEALLEASQFVHTLERRQGLKIACPEEIALNMGFIDRAQFASLAEKAPASEYGNYLRSVSQSP